MKIRCQYCDNYIDSAEEKCPNCGAINENLIRTSSGQPVTIRQLEDWYKSMNLPPYETTRFFINENRSDPKCFGIYQDSKGNFVVYKNKSDGTRAVRYAGKDEAFAVNEFYQKLKEEIINQKNHNQIKGNIKDIKRTVEKQSAIKVIKTVIITYFVINMISSIIVMSLVAFSAIKTPLTNKYNNGYYKYEDNYYYNSGYDWYKYSEDSDNWSKTSEFLSDDSLDNYDDYSCSLSDFENEYGTDSNNYSEWHASQVDSSSYSNDNDYSYDNDWDSGSSWDSSDSWDSGYSDWDSDW